MFLLRTVKESDLDDIFELSKLALFINLPRDRDKLKKKISIALRSFEKPSDDLSDNLYMFVAEDLETNHVVGTSLIHAQHGSVQSPHFYLRIGKEKKFSTTINTGFVHGTLKLGIDTDGPTEIGGLVLSEDYRKSEEKVGKQISFTRFLYMALFPDRFKDTIHSELLPPFDKDGNSPLWEALGKKFFNMDYHEADIISRKNKEFILNLFPSEVIYQTLLPAEARFAIGQVNENTKPVQKMLEGVGFQFSQEVDPFDGGPHYKCQRDEIYPIKHFYSGKFQFKKSLKDAKNYLVTLDKSADDFCAMRVSAAIEDDALIIDESYQNVLEKYGINGKIKAIPLFYR
ncbi:MAG: arginine N-succinyltransferase [Halobacteriovoraceae bacterium]|nr:arginine N-succinyltransferase [Halobacteriovoraceae bacterium]